MSAKIKQQIFRESLRSETDILLKDTNELLYAISKIINQLVCNTEW